MLKDKKPRAVNYELILEHDGEKQSEPYILLEEVRAASHPDIHGARIALAWRIALKPDTDEVKIRELFLQVADLDALAKNQVTVSFFAISKGGTRTQQEVLNELGRYGWTSSKQITRDKYEELCAWVAK